MSVDPDKPFSPDATTPKPAADSSGESVESIRLKKRFKKGAGAESEEGEKPDQTIQLLSTLLQDLIAKKESPGAPESESKSTKYHRLSKTGSGLPAGASEGTTSTVPVASAAPSASVSGSSAESHPAPAPPVAYRPASIFVPEAEVRRRRRLHLLYSFGALILAVVAYSVGSHYGAPNRNIGSPNKLPPVVAPVWSDAMLSQLDQAFAADQAGDLKGAQRLAEAIRKPETPSPPGLDLYLANLTTRQDHTFDVEADLLRANNNASPKEAAAINEGLAFNFSRSREFDKAVDFYKKSSQTDPFPASLFYHWGEALRHQGHSQDATAVFRRALDRIPTGQAEVESLRACTNFKLRLSLLERGQESEFQTEMAEQLKAPTPSGYWLLTAAAVALQHKNLPEAATLLGRARDALGTVQFEALLNDYFFRTFADRKELAEFFSLDPITRRAKLLPTMTYTIEP